MSTYDEGNKLYELAKRNEYLPLQAFLDGLAGDETALRNIVDWKNPGEYERTALMAAARNDNIECVSALLAAAAGVDLLDNDGWTALMSAASEGKVECVSALLAAGAGVDLQNNDGETALMYAASNGKVECVSALLAAGASVDLQNNYGYTVIDLAESQQIKDMLSNPAATIAAYKESQPKREFYKLAQNGDSAGLRAFLDGLAGDETALRNIVDWKNLYMDERTALMAAARNDKVECVAALLAAGASVDLQDNDGSTALDLAKRQQIKDMLSNPAAAIAAYKESQPKKKEENEDTAAAMAAALQTGGTVWRRSKLMIVGEGRAGKTAFSNSVIGREFEQTQSTIGITETTVCSVDRHQLTKGERGGFVEIEENNSELASALASVIKQQRKKKTDDKVDQGNLSMNHLLTDLGKERTAAATHARFGEEEANGSDSRSEVLSGEITMKAHAPASTMPIKTEAHPREKHFVQPETVTTTGISSSKPSEAATSATTTATTISKEVVTTTTPSLQVDEAEVMKCLSASTKLRSDDSLVLSVYDYGGQSVFDVIHHLFLTRYGMYALCFNMEWLLDGSPDTKRCLKYLLKWLNSIALHTYDADTGKSAPFVLVGTHGDIVSDPRQHEHVSRILEEKFHNHLVWGNKLRYEHAKDSRGDTTFCFFPVNNKKNNKKEENGTNPTSRLCCAVTADLMDTIDAHLNKEAYVQAKVPYAWLNTLDTLKKTEESLVNFSQVEEIACGHGVEKEHVKILLKFLHEMGILLWIDEPGVSDVVILDAIQYLVLPASTVICNHHGTRGDDSTAHKMKQHQACEQSGPNIKAMFDHLTDDGILDTNLLDILWADCIPEKTRLLHLMTKFGLLVPMTKSSMQHTASSATDEDDQNSNFYVVPALLPNDKHRECEDWGDEQIEKHTAFFVFSFLPELAQRTHLHAEDLQKSCFMPSGLFERVLGRCIVRAQATSPRNGIFNAAYYNDVAVLQFGKQIFRIIPVPEMNMLRVDSQGISPLAVTERVKEICEEVIGECMKLLCVIETVLWRDDGVNEQDASNAFLAEGNFADFMLIPLQSLRAASDQQRSLKKKTGRDILSIQSINRNYYMWVPKFDGLDEYDTFLSYRWVKFDISLVCSLFHACSYESVQGDGKTRPITVFLDRERLPVGERFDTTFSKALINSQVVVPIVSFDALERLTHDKFSPDEVDNVLVEWLLAVECQKLKMENPDIAVKVEKIIPVFLGKVSVSVGGDKDDIAPLFAKGTKGRLDALSEQFPAATIEFVKSMLKLNGLQPSQKSELDNYSVKAFVQSEIQTMNGVLAWYQDSRDLLDNTTKMVNDALDTIFRQHNKTKQQQQVQQPLEASASASALASGLASGPGGEADGASKEEEVRALSEELWAALMKESNAKDFVALKAFLDETGIEADTMVEVVEAPEITEKIVGHLKIIQGKKVAKIMKSLADASSVVAAAAV